MKLDPTMAQTIVKKMMDKIPYNINMMDENGYIIASGNSSRLNTLHVGAQMAIEQRKALLMEKEYGVHGQPGINMPVFFNNDIVGVIGITGNPTKVQPLAALLRTATELLLEQTEIDKKRRESEHLINNFLFQWTQITDNIESNTDLLLTANKLNINIMKPRTAIAIKGQQSSNFRIDAKDFIIPLSGNIKIILTEFRQNILTIIDYCTNHNLIIGVGEQTINVGKSINQAVQTINFNTILPQKNFIYYRQIEFWDNLLKTSTMKNQLLELFRSLNTSQMGQDLIATIGAYVVNNQNVDQTSKYLHVHRNTLNYRLKKINAITEYNPQETLDLFRLFLGYLYFKTKNK